MSALRAVDGVAATLFERHGARRAVNVVSRAPVPARAPAPARARAARSTRTDPRLVDAGDVVREYETRLTDGDNFVLDLVRPRAGTNAACDGVVVQMGLAFTETPDLANAVLDYDVWLIHREADGREVLDRMSGRGLQGHKVDYLFKRTRYDATGSADANGPVDVELRGSVKGRVRPDGQIDLAVGATRTVLKFRLGNSRGGNKQATISDGETIELEMPPYDLDDPGFKAQRTAIRVTVRRL